MGSNKAQSSACLQGSWADRHLHTPSSQTRRSPSWHGGMGPSQPTGVPPQKHSGMQPGRIRGRGLKGQAVSIDFMAGLFIFLVLLAYFLILWDIFSVRYNDLIEKGNTDIAALTVSDQLVRSSGDPFNWTASPSTASSLGLASTPGVLDPYRVAAFSTLPYADAKYMLGVDRDFMIIIEAPDGARYATLGQPPVNSTRAVEVTRVAILNGAMVNVRLQLYE